MSAQSSGTWKLVQVALGIAVSAACLWWAVHGMLRDPDAWPQVQKAFQTANYWLLWPYWFGLFLFYWLKSFRWKLLLAPIGEFRPLQDLLPPVLIGFAFNNVLPAHLGEFVRVFAFGRRQQVRFTSALTTVVLERVFDMCAIVTLLGGGLLFVKGLDPRLKNAALAGGVAALGVVLGGLAFVTWTRPVLNVVELILRYVPLLPATAKTRLCGLLETTAAGLSALRNPGLLAGILAISVAHWFINGWLIQLSLRSFGIHQSMSVCCILLGALAFAVAIPSSPGYFGVIQLCFMSVLKLFHDPQEQVFAASVFYQLAQYVPVTLLGLYFFNRAGLRLAEVRETTEAGDVAGCAG